MNWAGWIQLVVIELNQFALDSGVSEGPTLRIRTSPLCRASFRLMR